MCRRPATSIRRRLHEATSLDVVPLVEVHGAEVAREVVLLVHPLVAQRTLERLLTRVDDAVPLNHLLMVASVEHLTAIWAL